jgi:hypothetical protein
MGSDRARVSYDPSRQWRGLVAQQGRVTLEADVNEAADIASEAQRAAVADIVGPCGTPDGGYAVTAIPATGGPSGSTPGDLSIGAGVLYVGGERLELVSAVTYSAQPDWLDDASDPLWQAPAVPPGDTGELVYLLATEQEVSAVEDPALSDVALGGPDTMQRTRILQHFVRTATDATSCAGAWQQLEAAWASQGFTFDPASMRLASTASLLVSFETTPGEPNLCEPVAAGGYLGAENQLIRVQVAGVDAKGAPSIVWGYDDATFLYRIGSAVTDATADTTTVTLVETPVDSYHYPQATQYVEVLRDAAELTAADYIASATGWVSALTTAYNPSTGTVVIGGTPPAAYLDPAAPTPQLYLRVWQGSAPAPAGSPVALGDTGVQVTLTSPGGTFHAGDFWRFALRPGVPSLTYPARIAVTAQPPDGPAVWSCPLAFIAWADGTPTVSGCVPPFDNLVELTQHLGGCCSTEIEPGDVAGGASLQAVVDRYGLQGDATICLLPGTYTLTSPLMLTSRHRGLTLQGCRDGVVFRAANGSGEAFVLGLVVLQDVSSVTLQGIEFDISPVAFRSSSDTFSGLVRENAKLLESYARDLGIEIGMSVHGAADLRVQECTFSFSNREANLFGAAIYATGEISNLTLAKCWFGAPDAARVPFADLITGQAQGPYLLRFGYLQVPNASTPTTVTEGEVVPRGNAVGVAVAGTAAPGAVSASPVLDGARIVECTFEGLTVAVLGFGTLGAVRLDGNTVVSCYGGFWLLSVDSPVWVSVIDRLAGGDPNTLNALSSPALLPLSVLADRVLALALAIARVLPQSPPAGASGIFRAIPGVTAADLASSLRRFTAVASSLFTAAPATSVAAKVEKKVADLISEVPPAIKGLFQHPAAADAAAEIPEDDPGTALVLRIEVAANEVDAVIEASYSGAGLAILDLAKGSSGGSVIMGGNRIRSRYPTGFTASLVRIAEGTLTGNVVANELQATQGAKLLAAPAEQTQVSRSLVLTPWGTIHEQGPPPALAVTGNVFIGAPNLPPRPGVAAPLNTWEPFNAITTYPPA